MVPNPGLLRHYSRLERILKDIALRLKLILSLEFFLRLAAVFIILLLGSLFVQEVRGLFPYLPFIYSLLSLAILAWVLLQGLWRVASRLTLQGVARGLEEKVPLLKDDVTNSLLLFHQIRGKPVSDNISEGLVNAHLRKTVAVVSKIRPGQVLSYKKVLSHLKLVVPIGLAFVAVVTLDSQFLGRSTATVFKPFTVLPLRETIITLEKAPATVLRGTSLLIRAGAAGYIPEELALKLWPEKGAEIRFAMTSEGNGGFSYRIASAQSSFRYQAVSDRAGSADYHVQVVEAPDISNIRLTLIPPGYTGLPKEIITGGHIEALKGTVVNLQAQANKPIREGILTLNMKNQLPLHIEGDRLVGTFLVFYPGAYSLSIKDEFGFENADPVAYRVGLIPDKYPEGEIVSPSEELQVSGAEVLPLIYTARDDFGLTTIRLVYQMGGMQRSITLRNLKGSRSTDPQQYDWDLAAMALTPGDRITYRLEVWDNDSVSGPKVGYSRTNTIYLRDEKDQAAREVERARQIWDALLNLLADQLEETRDRKGLADELARIMSDVDRYLERMGREQIERYDLGSLKRNMDALNRKIDDLPKEKITQELERLTLLAEELLKKARMQEVEALSREIKNRQTRFIDALRDQKGPLTPERLQGLLKELEKLKDLTAQVMEALSQMAVQLPDDFINSPELEGLNFQDLFKDLDAIQQKLMAGDLKGALEAAQRLLQNLSEMMAAMARAGAQSRMGSFDRLQSEMSRQTSELEKIVNEQREILAGTEAIEQELRRSLEAEIENRLEQMMIPIQLTLDQLQSLLSSEQRDVVSEMKKLLKEEEIERFSELADNLTEEFKDNPAVRKVADELVRVINGLTPAPIEAMTEELREEFPELSARQEQLYEKTTGLGDMLETLSQLFPGMDSEIIHDIKTAAGAMGQASAKLKQTDAPGAIPPEEEAIQSLTRSQQSMQQMARQMAMQMQLNRWGYPLAYDPRHGWYYGPWGSLPTLPQPEVKQRRERGYTGIDKEEFDPPAKDAYKVPQALREKVLEALKEDIPPQYQREVKRYFKGLTE